MNMKAIIISLGAILLYAASALIQPKPQVYDEYVAIIAQSGTAAPTATVLEGLEAGTVTLGRTDVGRYTFTLTGAFLSGKTFVDVSNGDVGDFDFNEFEAGRVDDNTISLRTSADGSLGDLDGNPLYISIRIYP